MYDDHPVSIGVLIIDLYIPESNSLKTKRRVLRSLKDRVRAHFNVSISEIAELEKWQRAICGVVMISNDEKHVGECLQKVLNLARSLNDAQVVDSRIEFL